MKYLRTRCARMKPSNVLQTSQFRAANQFIANKDSSFDNIMKQRHITIVTTFINSQPTSHIPCK